MSQEQEIRIRNLEAAVASLQAASKPDDGWSLSDFTASVSEVISDKRDLIRQLESISDIAEQKKTLDAVITKQKQEIDALIAKEKKYLAAAEAFNDVLIWWDQNYNIIMDAKEALALNREVVNAASNTQAAVRAAESAISNHRIESLKEVTNTKSEAIKEIENLVRGNNQDWDSKLTQSKRYLTDADAALDVKIREITGLVETANAKVAESKSEALKWAQAELLKAGTTLEEMKRLHAKVKAAVDEAKQELSSEIAELYQGAPERHNTMAKISAILDKQSRDIAAAAARASTAIQSADLTTAPNANAVVQRDPAGNVILPASDVRSDNVAASFGNVKKAKSDLASEIQAMQNRLTQVQHKNIGGIDFRRIGNTVTITTNTRDITRDKIKATRIPSWAVPPIDVRGNISWGWGYGGRETDSSGYVEAKRNGEMDSSYFSHLGVEFSLTYAVN